MVETPESAGPTDLQAPSAPDAAAPAKPAVQRIKVEGELKVLGGSASSFEMKLVGTSLQLHPAISANGKQIEVQVLLSHTAFTGWQKISMEMSPTHKVTVEQPNFQVIKTDRQITVIDGKPALLNLSKLVEPKGMFEISILTATIIDIGK